MKKRIKRNLRIARYVVYKETLIDRKDIFWSFLGSFIAIGCIASFSNALFQITDTFFLIGSLGASAILVFGASNSPLAQPRNLIGGHVISALIGVSIGWIIQEPKLMPLAAALAVSLALVGMQITKTMHPPGGATALLAIIGSEKIKKLGYFYVLSPVLSGALVMLVIALILNNIPGSKKYPSKREWF